MLIDTIRANKTAIITQIKQEYEHRSQLDDLFSVMPATDDDKKRDDFLKFGVRYIFERSQLLDPNPIYVYELGLSIVQAEQNYILAELLKAVNHKMTQIKVSEDDFISKVSDKIVVMKQPIILMNIDTFSKLKLDYSEDLDFGIRGPSIRLGGKKIRILFTRDAQYKKLVFVLDTGFANLRYKQPESKGRLQINFESKVHENIGLLEENNADYILSVYTVIKLFNIDSEKIHILQIVDS